MLNRKKDRITYGLFYFPYGTGAPGLIGFFIIYIFF